MNNGEFEKAIGWWSPTGGTPDFFHRCNDTTGAIGQGSVSVPNNFWGHQEAFQGDGYVGFLPYEWIDETGEIVGSEYIGTKLKYKLNPCYTYGFRMWLNLANNSTYGYTKIGVYITDELIQTNNSNLLIKNAQIINEEYITDTSERVLVNGRFQSKGNEQYLYIGYFDEP